tara:strand:- start:16159 stop:16506 length:348 start_codon:yes stop_codon:yes gene_type:complete
MKAMTMASLQRQCYEINPEAQNNAATMLQRYSSLQNKTRVNRTKLKPRPIANGQRTTANKNSKAHTFKVIFERGSDIHNQRFAKNQTGQYIAKNLNDDTIRKMHKNHVPVESNWH